MSWTSVLKRGQHQNASCIGGQILSERQHLKSHRFKHPAFQRNTGMGCSEIPHQKRNYSTYICNYVYYNILYISYVNNCQYIYIYIFALLSVSRLQRLLKRTKNSRWSSPSCLHRPGAFLIPRCHPITTFNHCTCPVGNRSPSPDLPCMDPSSKSAY